MPMITAANAPYNPVPSQSPSPTTGNDYQNIAGATPEAFGYGVGQAESKLGATTEEAGNRLADRAIEQQQLINRTAANNSTNWFNDEATKILHGDPNVPGDVGYYGLKGLDAVNARQVTMQKIDSLLQSARGKLTNQRQILEFDNESRRQRNFLADRIGSHYDQQLTQSAVNSANAGYKLAGNAASIAAANLDWEAFNHSVEDQMKSAIDGNKAAGGTQIMLDEKFQEIRGSATAQWVESLVEKNPTQARDFLEKNKDALVANEYHRLQGMVRARADKAELDRWVNGPPRGGMVSGGGATGGHDIPGLYNLAVQAGYAPGQQAATAAAISMAESSGNPNAHNTKGEDSYGLMQLNADAHGDLARTFDPLENMRRSRVVSEGGTNWQPWSVFKNGSYKQFMPAALAAAASGPVDKMVPVFDAENKVHNLTPVQYKAYLNVGEDKQTDFLKNLVTAPGIAPPPDVLINNRPLPIREPNELPDAEIPGAYFPGNQTLSQRIQQLAQTMPNENEHDAAMFAAAVKLARTQANSQYSDQQHAHRIQQEADKANDQALMTQYQQRMASNSANYPTSNEVLSDKRWKDPAAQRQMVGFIERESKQDPAAAASKINTNALYTQMSLPEGTEGRINSESAITNSYIKGDITQKDHDWLIKQFRDSRSAGGETFAKLRAEFIRMVAEPQIKGADPQYDNLWGDRLFQYQSKLDSDIKRYEDSGKNKFDLFDPSKPEYAGRDDFIGWYRSKMFSSFKDAPDAALPVASIDLGSPDKVKAAYESHELTWDQAADALQKLGHPLRQPALTGPQVPVR